MGLCACAGAPGDVPGGRLAIDVAPLSLTGLADATYTLRVVNGLDQEVWVKTVTSTQHGDGAGAVSYVGPCDADPAAQPNRIELVVDGIADASGALTEGVDWANPAPTGAPLVLEATCDPDRDVAVDFDIAIARAARQGFFDVAVELVDVFCSAKLDCQNDSGQPLQLLHNADGQRDTTAVLALACTGGPGSTTELYMSDIVVTCGGDTTTIDPALGPGKLSVIPASGLPDTHIFDALVTAGSELLGTYDKKYWNVALGLADVTGCTLSATATASDGALTDGATPVGTTWPVIHWAGDFDACTRHGLDSGDGVVTTQYTDFAGQSFPHYASAAGIGTYVFEIPIVGALVQGDAGQWEDGTYAVSCYDYRYPSAGLYTYTGSTGDGWYTIDPDGAGAIAPYEVYCDQTTASAGVDGGWTLLVDWNRETGTDSWATLRTKMVQVINQMGEQVDRAGYIEWSDLNASYDVMDFRVDAGVPNAGQIRATIHAQGVSNEDSAILFFTHLANGTDVNVVCADDARTGGAWTTYTAAERAYYPGYICPVQGAAAYDYTWNTTYDQDHGSEIDAFHLVSFQADNNGGDSSYLFKLIVYVR
ncbi:MAG: hypothetical protein EP329_11280 [Deltaproteobacteria bacterium]|nr:MAG: hypothetical protein EP329_11280 [Deltaproteobacteria bacterium]